jgi:leucyl/phenylalanyl-tRNA--protein transferase
MQLILTPDLILDVYRQGIFPMAYSGDSPYVHWICPEMRGQLPIADFHIPRSVQKLLKKTILGQGEHQIKTDMVFREVIEACAAPASHRPQTWINQPIIDVFCDLHIKGHAHSVEYWVNGRLAGGVYGLALGGAFFAESMFSGVPGGSKIALIALVARLYKAGFTMLDTQFANDHLRQFGVYEIPHVLFKTELAAALAQAPDWTCGGMSEIEILRDFLWR